MSYDAQIGISNENINLISKNLNQDFVNVSEMLTSIIN